MRAAASASLLAAVALAASLASPGAAQEPVAPPLPPPAAPGAGEAPALPPGHPAPPADERPRRVPVQPAETGELPPPRAIAAPPAGSRWPEGLVRRTSLGLNLLGFVPGPEEGAAGTWRIEGVFERAYRPNVGAAAIVSAGQVHKDGHDDATTVGLSAQYRWYFAGRFDRGAYLAGALGFWFIDPYVAWSLGGGVGFKRTFAGGLTLDLQAGLQLPLDSFRTDEGGNPPALEDAWRALLPGPLVSIGASFAVPEYGRSTEAR